MGAIGNSIRTAASDLTTIAGQVDTIELAAANAAATIAARDATIVTLNSTIATRDATIATLNATVEGLEADLAECVGEPPVEPPPPPPPPPPDPELPQLPDIPAGTDIDADDVAAALLAAPNGKVYRVRPGTAVNHTLVLKPGQQVWGLGGFDPAPGKMPKFTGPNLYTDTRRWARGAGGESNPTPDCVIAYLEFEKYHVANPSWVNLTGDQSANRRLPALWMHTFQHSWFIGLWGHDNGTAISMGDNCEMNGGLFEWNHHMWLHVSRGTAVHDWHLWGGTEARHNNKRRSDGQAIFGKGWERGMKVVRAKDFVVEDVYSHDNNGAGWWNDNNDVDNIVLRRLRCFNNLDQGIHHEISRQALIENCEAKGNGAAGNLYLSNARGYSGNPIVVRGGVYGPHALASINIKNNASRSPLVDFIRVENLKAEKVNYFVDGNPPKPTSLVVTGVTNAAGATVKLTGL
jgi:hypothetical protein